MCACEVLRAQVITPLGSQGCRYVPSRVTGVWHSHVLPWDPPWSHEGRKAASVGTPHPSVPHPFETHVFPVPLIGDGTQLGEEVGSLLSGCTSFLTSPKLPLYLGAFDYNTHV